MAASDAIRELTANLLRLVRGTGRPDDVLPQAREFVACCAAYREIVGCDPRPEDWAEALSLKAAPSETIEDEASGDWDRAVSEMVNGALQVAAAELLDQRAQAAAGRRELFAGYRDVEKIHARQLARLWRRGAS